MKLWFRLGAAAFAILLLAGISGPAARAAGPYDGVYNGTTDSPDRRCQSGKFSMTVKDNVVTKWGAHGVSGSVSGDGSVSVHTTTFAGATATTTGKISGGVFTGDTVEQGGFACVWHLKLTSGS